jgi:hypothetical protein
MDMQIGKEKKKNRSMSGGGGAPSKVGRRETTLGRLNK